MIIYNSLMSTRVEIIILSNLMAMSFMLLLMPSILSILQEMIINRSESLDFEFIDLNDIPDNLAKSHKPIISDFINKFMTK